MISFGFNQIAIFYKYHYVAVYQHLILVKIMALIVQFNLNVQKGLHKTNKSSITFLCVA